MGKRARILEWTPVQGWNCARFRYRWADKGRVPDRNTAVRKAKLGKSVYGYRFLSIPVALRLDCLADSPVIPDSWGLAERDVSDLRIRAKHEGHKKLQS